MTAFLLKMKLLFQYVIEIFLKNKFRKVIYNIDFKLQSSTTSTTSELKYHLFYKGSNYLQNFIDLES